MIPEFIHNNLVFFIFVLLLSVFLYVKRKNIQVAGSFPILYMVLYKTRLGLDKMDAWSKKHPKLFLYLSYFSIFIAIVGVFASFIFMLWQLNFIAEHHIEAGGGLVLPIKTEKGLDSAVPVFYIPFWYWLIALFVLVIVHEFAHGVIAERFNVRVKSSGFAFLGILAPLVPAAFVEPDEKQLAKKPKWQRIAVFGAGSASNFIFGFLFLGLWILLSMTLIQSSVSVDKISFTSVMNESSLVKYNLTGGEIVAFNNITDKEQILVSFRNISVNQSIALKINTSEGIHTYNVTPFHNEEENRSMIGISGLKIDYGNKPGWEWIGKVPLHLERILFYIWFLNLAIGLFNLLPIWITDGGQIFRTLLTYWFSDETSLKIYTYISLLSLMMIIFTVWPELMFKILDFM